jgi:hypothetical protein
VAWEPRHRSLARTLFVSLSASLFFCIFLSLVIGCDEVMVSKGNQEDWEPEFYLSAEELDEPLTPSHSLEVLTNKHFNKIENHYVCRKLTSFDEINTS